MLTLENPPAPRFPIRLLKATINLTLATIDLYALGLVFYLLVRFLISERYWMIALTSNFIHWLLLPSSILLPIMLFRKRWFKATIFAVHAMAFIALFGTLFTPKSHAAPGDAITLKAMTYNIASYGSDPNTIIAGLRDAEADIIGLQEVSESHGEKISAALADLYPYQVVNTIPGNVIDGRMLLSRYPILEYEIFQVAASGRPHIQATLDVDGQAVMVFVLHPFAPSMINGWQFYQDSPLTALELPAVLDRIPAGHAAVLLGDFNLVDQSPNYDILIEGGLTDAFRAVGWGFGATFPADIGVLGKLPALYRIDYVWTTDHFQPLDAYVGEDAGSDHLPMVAELAFGQ